jgi:AraC family transcriptional regulator
MTNVRSCFTNTMASVRHWPGMRTEHAWLPPHDDPPSTTGADQIGVAFTGHRGVVYAARGSARSGDIAPGSTIVSGGGPIEWLRVREATEALEIYPDPALLAAVPAAIDQRIGCHDGTVLGIATVLRRAHVTGGALSDVAASTLAHRLVGHLLHRYAGARDTGRRAGGLAGATVDRVTELVEARLPEVLTLDDLAAVARLSPYHFSRAFRASTGLAPYAFVTARRMDRARLLLGTTGRTVEEVAAGVGFTNLSHFRRTFRRHHGVPPSAARPQEPTFRAGTAPGQPGSHADQ